MNQDPIPLKNQKTRSLFADTVTVYIRTYCTVLLVPFFEGYAFIKRRFDPYRGNKINRTIGREGISFTLYFLIFTILI
jgi:hypothetical protein